VRRNPHPQTETPAFKRWFGASKVVDAQGAPRVMYHGTYEDFDVFDRLFMRSSRGRESLDQVGSWFSTEPGKSGAGMYISDTEEGAKIVPVYLSIQHPWTVTFRGMWRAAQRMSGQDENARPNAASVQALDDWMDAVGIDGIHIRPDPRNGAEFAGQDVWVARRPTQIKSAIGNRGTFDPEDPSIVRNPRRKNPEDAPARIRLQGFSTTRVIPPAVEAFLHDLFEASYPNPLSDDTSSRILAHAEVLVEVTPMHGGIHIDEFQAVAKRQGAGTEALQFLTGLADKHGISLYLHARPFGHERMSLEELERFYRRHGFRADDEEEDDDEGTHMHRWPREVVPVQKNPRGLDVRRGIPGTYRTRFVAKSGRKRAYPAQGGAPWDRAMVRVASETTLSGGRIYDTVERASRAGRASAPGKRGSVTVERVTNPRRKNPPRKKFSAAPLTDAEKQQVRRANVYLMDWVCDGWGPLPPSIAAFEERHGALTNAEQRELIGWYENRTGELDV
jgi:GNAT superfamily N-acetyltransferase